MAATRISITEFLTLAEDHLVIDVRSPSEYSHAHFPKAVSLPLFDDEERKIVGTTYKQHSRQDAIKIGLDYFGPKMKEMVNAVEHLLQQRKTNTVIVHCWRGGMRSGAVSWLLDLYGFKVYTLDGGYKKFRNWVLDQLAAPQPFRVLGGYTGSAKTETLQELARMGEFVIDLEDLAMHKGSAFGGLGLPPQCSAEQFENKLALALHNITIQNVHQQPVWIESESRRIGNINLQHTFVHQMQKAPYLLFHIPFEQRLKHIVAGYGAFNRQDILNAIYRIKKRLGGLETKTAIAHLLDDDIEACFRILLKYYDKFYNNSSLEFAQQKISLELESTDARANAAIILQKMNNLHE